MTATIDFRGLEDLFGKMARVRAGALQKDLVANLHGHTGEIRADMAGATFTRIQKRAMDSVDLGRLSDGIEIHGGGSGGLPATLFPGAEFGGRKSKKVTYITRSRRGRSYSVRRRTTMQFLPHLGREGYFFWPTVRDWLPRLHQEAIEIISKTVT